MSDKVNKVNYSDTEDSVLKSPGLVAGFVNRLPNAFEGLSSEITNDALVSVKSKVWYWKLDGDSKVSSDTVKHLGINNKWYKPQGYILG